MYGCIINFIVDEDLLILTSPRRETSLFNSPGPAFCGYVARFFLCYDRGTSLFQILFTPALLKTYVLT